MTMQPARQSIDATVIWQVVVLPLVLVGIVVIATATESPFWTETNLRIIMLQAAMPGLMAVGMTFAMLKGGIDLSVGSVAALAGVIAASLLDGGALVMILAGLAAGLVVGLVNGVFITFARGAAVVATLATLIIARSLALMISDGLTITVDDELIRLLGSEMLFDAVAVPALIALAAVVVGTVILAAGMVGGKAGRGDERPSAATVAVYVASGLLAALAGVLLVGRLGAATPSVGYNMEITAVAAVMLGGTAIGSSPRPTSVIGAAIGVVILSVLANAMILHGFDSFVTSAVPGAVILVAIVIQFAIRAVGRSGEPHPLEPGQGPRPDSWASLPPAAPPYVQPQAPAPYPPPESGQAGPTASSPTRTCPECAETILADARICRYCRYEFWTN